MINCLSGAAHIVSNIGSFPGYYGKRFSHFVRRLVR